MPTKRNRRGRHRYSDDLRAWQMMFVSGFDFFHDLAPLGIDESTAREAAPEAWQRLGAAFLDAWKASPHVDDTAPWALEQFGPPRP